MVAQFHEVIRGRCGGRGEPERNGLAGLDQLGAVMPIGRFKDAALIQNDRAELRQVEMIQLLIVGNTDAFAIAKMRSEERRVGKECVSTCRSRWSPYLETKTKKEYCEKHISEQNKHKYRLGIV